MQLLISDGKGLCACYHVSSPYLPNELELWYFDCSECNFG